MTKTLLFSLMLAIPAFAQEPRTPIKPADPIAAATYDVHVACADYSDKQVVLPPTPLPLLKVSLGEYARLIRAAHATAPKAVKITSNDRFDAELEAKATEGK